MQPMQPIQSMHPRHVTPGAIDLPASAPPRPRFTATTTPGGPVTLALCPEPFTARITRDDPELARLRAATACGISQARMRGGLLSPHELSMLADALNAHAELPIDTIDDVHTVEGIRARVLAEAARADVGLVVVDYFQMLQSAEDGRDENVNTAARWNALKRVARDARVPMLVVSSLTKGGQRNAREKGSPEQTDARGSGPEYAADVMLFLTCESPTDSVREVIVHVKKNRQGPLGPVTLIFDATRGRFRGKSYERLPESDDGDNYGGMTARGGDAE